MNMTATLSPQDLTLAQMASMLDAPEATRLDSHIERIRYYARRGIPASIASELDFAAVMRANMQRVFDDRETISMGEYA